MFDLKIYFNKNFTYKYCSCRLCLKCFNREYKKIIDFSTKENFIYNTKCLICHSPDANEEEIHGHFIFIKDKVI